MTLLVLRAEPGAGATCARAAALGMAAVAAPLFAARAVAWATPGGRPDAVMATSAHALRLGGDGLAALTGLPLYAVGGATAAAARAAGFGDVRAGAGDVAALVGRAAADGVTRLLHLGGRERREVAHPAVAIAAVTVYAVDAVDILPERAQDALAAGAVALLHSPRAAETFARLAGQAGLRREGAMIAAISPAARDAAGPGWRAAVAAEKPTDAALLAAAARLCQ